MRGFKTPIHLENESFLGVNQSFGTLQGESMSFKDLVHYLRARFAVEEAQTMAEYGVVLAVIAVAVVVALGLLSTSISSAFDSVRSSL